MDALRTAALAPFFCAGVAGDVLSAITRGLVGGGGGNATKLGVRRELLATAVVAASAGAVAAAYCFPGSWSRSQPQSKQDAAWWAKLCLQICSQGPLAKASRIYDLLTIDDVGADGTVRARLRWDVGPGETSRRVVH
jgi:hypothetical protein